VLWIRITLMRIWIRLITLMRIRILIFLLDADPDPAFHPDADPDPDPNFKQRLEPLKNTKICSHSLHLGLKSAN
jgi:hypothetical protein